MEYHGGKDIEAKKSYIKDFSIDTEEKILTIVTMDGRERYYQFNEENMKKLETIYNEQSDTAIENIPTYKFNRVKSRVLAATMGVAGIASGVALTNALHADPLVVGTAVGTVTLLAESVFYGMVTRPITKKLEEAVHFKALRKHGAAVVDYMTSSDNAFAGFSDARKEELLGLIAQGADPSSILEIDGVGLSTEEIKRFAENKKVENQYKFTPVLAKRRK